MVMERIDTFQTKAEFSLGNRTYTYYSLNKLAEHLQVDLQKLPVSIKILLENMLRSEDGKLVTDDHIKSLGRWSPDSGIKKEIPFMPARVLMQDFTGVPAVADLTAMRDAVSGLGGNPELINPNIPTHLVIDHSVQVDSFGSEKSFGINTEKEFQRNTERYSFLKWGQNQFTNFKVVPPATGICHQVNLEYLASVVVDMEEDGQRIVYPDTLVGLDSHTTMINGLGVMGWGVGGIEAEAVMLGQPYYMLTPRVIGFELTGRLPDDATATDLVLSITQIMRERGVVGTFIEFFGNGLDALSLPDRATIANMTPEFGATMSFFPVDDETLNYLRFTGRPEEHIGLIRHYLKEQTMFRPDSNGNPLFSDIIRLDISRVEPSLAGPKRPQDRISLNRVKQSFLDDPAVMVPETPSASIDETTTAAHAPPDKYELSHGSVVIAAITSCTNTSNPSVLLGAGLMAKKAAEYGLEVKPWVKTSLAPGSTVVTEYLSESGLMPYLKKLGFHTVAYGCTTCIGNSGPLDAGIADIVKKRDLIVASVLSGNRNFEGRINPLTRANYLASPMLVIAYALAGRVDIDMETEPLGYSPESGPVFLKDIWPPREEINRMMNVLSPSMFKKQYQDVFNGDDNWQHLDVKEGTRYAWEDDSTYIKRPPFLEGMTMDIPGASDIKSARILALLGDSITTDHISPAGAIPEDSPAGEYLLSRGVEEEHFNSYGSRRGNHDVMMRGTFGNVRLKNLMVPGKEGGWTVYLPSGETLPIFQAAEKYRNNNTPLVVVAGKEYGTGSSRDWAAKGTLLLGVKAVIAESFERIHRSNLVAMGVLPLQFNKGQNAVTLGLNGEDVIDIEGFDQPMAPNQEVSVKARKTGGETIIFTLTTRIDSLAEVDYYRHGGILPYVVRQLLGSRGNR